MATFKRLTVSLLSGGLFCIYTEVRFGSGRRIVSQIARTRCVTCPNEPNTTGPRQDDDLGPLPPRRAYYVLAED
jgi:hypothetical protein